MKRLLIILMFAMPLYAQKFYSTSFPATENPISETGAWISGGAAGSCSGSQCWANVQTSPGKAFGREFLDTNQSFTDGTALLTGTWGRVQLAQATVYTTAGVPSVGSPNWPEVELRLNSTISAQNLNGYEVDVAVDSTGTSPNAYLAIVRWNGPRGNFTNLALLDINGTSLGTNQIFGAQYGVKNGDLLLATIDATGHIKVYKNGTFLAQAIDTTYTGGSPGIGFNSEVTGANDSTYGFSSFFASSGQILAVTCGGSDITAAQASASVGNTVVVPPGNCSWSGLTFNKALTWLGSGTSTAVTLSNSSTNTVTKQSAGNIRFSNFGFTISSSPANNAAKAFTLGGAWKTAKPTIWDNNTISITGTGFFLVTVNGHVFSHNTITLGWDDSIWQIKDATDAEGSWTSVSSMGTADTNGEWNTYMEDNTITGGANQGLDCDDACRLVFRHNLTVNFDAAGHGFGSSSFGSRHWEIYNNDMRSTCSQGTDCGANSNVQHFILPRGGTGVIFNNVTDNLSTTTWGVKTEVSLGQDTNHLAGCPADASSYPLNHQFGRGYNGSTQFLDPIYLWNNSVNPNGNAPRAFDMQAVWFYGCATPITDYVQAGREYFDNSTNTTAKPGYTAFTYPHPLVGGSAPVPPPPSPANMFTFVRKETWPTSR